MSIFKSLCHARCTPRTDLGVMNGQGGGGGPPTEETVDNLSNRSGIVQQGGWKGGVTNRNMVIDGYPDLSRYIMT